LLAAFRRWITRRSLFHIASAITGDVRQKPLTHDGAGFCGGDIRRRSEFIAMFDQQPRLI
jgi:hypothetical protein